MEESKDMENKKSYIIHSCIIGFLVTGLFINGFGIYSALAFHETVFVLHKVLFLICGSLFLIFLGLKSVNVFKAGKNGTITCKNLLLQVGLTILLSLLWMIPFYMLWGWIDTRILCL